MDLGIAAEARSLLASGEATKSELVFILRDLGFSWGEIARIIYGDSSEKHKSQCKALYRYYVKKLGNGNGKELRVAENATYPENPIKLKKRSKDEFTRQRWEYEQLMHRLWETFLADIDKDKLIWSTIRAIHHKAFPSFYEAKKANVWVTSRRKSKTFSAGSVAMSYIFWCFFFALHMYTNAFYAIHRIKNALKTLGFEILPDVAAYVFTAI